MGNNEERIRFANDQIFGKGNLHVVNEIFAADYVAHADGKEFRGHEFVKGFIGQLRAAVPDIRVVEVALMIEAGDRVAWQRMLRGTHQADMMGIPASGQKVEWRDQLVTRFEDGKIAEEWMVSDLVGQLLLKLPKP